MQHFRSSMLWRVRLAYGACGCLPNLVCLCKVERPLYGLMARYMCASSDNTSSEHLTARVIELVKKFDKMDASMVTETADFQKDLSLDSLDRVELVMAFEQEFSIEIPDDKADKLTCCADVVKYIQSEARSTDTENS